MSVYLLRHGETELNAREVMNSRFDSPLSDTGVKQAFRAALKLKRLGITKILCSPSKRARQTAEIVNSYLLCPQVSSCACLAEMDLGAAEGLPLATYLTLKMHHAVGAANDARLLERRANLKRAIVKLRQGVGSALVVSHAKLIEFILNDYITESHRQFVKHYIANCEVIDPANFDRSVR